MSDVDPAIDDRLDRLRADVADLPAEQAAYVGGRLVKMAYSLLGPVYWPIPLSALPELERDGLLDWPTGAAVGGPGRLPGSTFVRWTVYSAVRGAGYAYVRLARLHCREGGMRKDGCPDAC